MVLKWDPREREVVSHQFSIPSLKLSYPKGKDQMELKIIGQSLWQLIVFYPISSVWTL